jgi:hypothetical protein
VPNQNDHLDLINIPSPCSADWGSMTGNNRVRFCDQCHQSVHNLSEMTPRAAIKLIATSKGRLCARYDMRPESVAQPAAAAAAAAPPLYQIGRRASRIAAGVFSATLSLSATAIAQMRPKTNPLIYAGVETAASREAGRKARLDGLTGSIVGRVIDPDDGTVPGARVTLINESTQVEIVVISDEEGEFRFRSLETGSYTLTTALPGFKTAMIERIYVEANAEERVVARLEIGAIGGDVSITPPSEPLVRAAMDDDLAALRKLLDTGANVNAADEGYGMTALGMAAGRGDLKMVQLLLWYGADVNAQTSRGYTALMSLSGPSTPEVVRALITAGAKIDLQDDAGDTALMHLASDNNTGALQALIDAGANVHLKNKRGQTALMLAAGTGVVANVKALLAAGANLYERDEEGGTVLKYARANGHDDVLKMLRAYGSID